MEQELLKCKKYQTILKIKIGVLSLCILMQLSNILYWAEYAQVLSFIIALTFGSQGVLSLIGVRALDRSCTQFKKATGLYILQLAALVLLRGSSNFLGMIFAGAAFGFVMNGFSERAKRIPGEESILIRKFSNLFLASFFLTSSMLTIMLIGFFVALAWKPEQALFIPVLLQLVVAGFMTAWLILYLLALKTVKLYTVEITASGTHGEPL